MSTQEVVNLEDDDNFYNTLRAGSSTGRPAESSTAVIDIQQSVAPSLPPIVGTTYSTVPYETGDDFYEGLHSAATEGQERIASELDEQQQLLEIRNERQTILIRDALVAYPSELFNPQDFDEPEDLKSFACYVCRDIPAKVMVCNSCKMPICADCSKKESESIPRGRCYLKDTLEDDYNELTGIIRRDENGDPIKIKVPHPCELESEHTTGMIARKSLKVRCELGCGQLDIKLGKYEAHIATCPNRICKTCGLLNSTEHNCNDEIDKYIFNLKRKWVDTEKKNKKRIKTLEGRVKEVVKASKELTAYRDSTHNLSVRVDKLNEELSEEKLKTVQLKGDVRDLNQLIGDSFPTEGNQMDSPQTRGSEMNITINTIDGRNCVLTESDGVSRRSTWNQIITKATNKLQLNPTNYSLLEVSHRIRNGDIFVQSQVPRDLKLTLVDNIRPGENLKIRVNPSIQQENRSTSSASGRSHGASSASSRTSSSSSHR